MITRNVKVAPSRARGLKRWGVLPSEDPLSVAPSRARGLKQEPWHRLHFQRRRAFTGAWIETISLGSTCKRNSSRAFTGAWIETGEQRNDPGTYVFVAPFTGAWIETMQGYGFRGLYYRRAFTGAWIETKFRPVNGRAACCRAFTGAWIETVTRRSALLDPRRAFTGAWIETAAHHAWV